MSLSYPLALPSAFPVRRVQWQPQGVQAVSTSPFTGQQQVYDWQAGWRVVNIELAAMSYAVASDVWGWLQALNGQVGTFTFAPPAARRQRGRATGAPLVDGASQTGTTLSTDGWTPSVEGILLRGDWISISDRLYTATADADSGADGSADLELWPAIDTAPSDDTTIETSECRGVFRLTSFVPLSWDVEYITRGLTLQAREDTTP